MPKKCKPKPPFDPSQSPPSPPTTALAPPPDEAARIDQIFKWIIAGHTERDIAEAVRGQWPDADSRPLIVAAIVRIRESGKVDHGTVMGWCVEATRDLYRRMVEIGDFAGALRAVKQMEHYANK